MLLVWQNVKDLLSMLSMSLSFIDVAKVQLINLAVAHYGSLRDTWNQGGNMMLSEQGNLMMSDSGIHSMSEQGKH